MSLWANERMMSLTRTLALLLVTGGLLSATAPFDHTLWDQVLRAHVNDLGEVDYAAIRQSPERFEAYLSLLAAASPDNDPERFPSREHEIAYWINAYNAFAVKGVLDHYPLESVRKVRRFFEKRVYDAGARELSLDDIEHGILRQKYEEPRIHFAIVCASVSCPFLWNRAVTGDRLDEQLDRLARVFVNQRRNLDVDLEQGKVTLSKIFDWFEEDFEKATGRKGPAAVLAFVEPFADASMRKKLSQLRSPKIRYASYDWSLNEPGARAASSNPLEAQLSGETGVER